MQIKRHAPYSALQPIQSLPAPFYTLMMDFIPALLKIKDRENMVFSVINKYIKRVTLIVRKDIWGGPQWA